MKDVISKKFTVLYSERNDFINKVKQVNPAYKFIEYDLIRNKKAQEKLSTEWLSKAEVEIIFEVPKVNLEPLPYPEYSI